MFGFPICILSAAPPTNHPPLTSMPMLSAGGDLLFGFSPPSEKPTTAAQEEFDELCFAFGIELKDVEREDLLGEVRSLATVQSGHQSEKNQLRAQLDSERKNESNIMLKLQEEHQLNESSQRELHDLKSDKERMATWDILFPKADVSSREFL